MYKRQSKSSSSSATFGSQSEMATVFPPCSLRRAGSRKRPVSYTHLIISCEGDVRIYIDGKRTPQVESDGSESYVCYGWGFPTPPEVHPMGGMTVFRITHGQ